MDRFYSMTSTYYILSRLSVHYNNYCNKLNDVMRLNRISKYIHATDGKYSIFWYPVNFYNKKMYIFEISKSSENTTYDLRTKKTNAENNICTISNKTIYWEFYSADELEKYVCTNAIWCAICTNKQYNFKLNNIWSHIEILYCRFATFILDVKCDFPRNYDLYVFD